MGRSAQPFGEQRMEIGVHGGDRPRRARAIGIDRRDPGRRREIPDRHAKNPLSASGAEDL
jgi:hypothetical protein